MIENKEELKEFIKETVREILKEEQLLNEAIVYATIIEEENKNIICELPLNEITSYKDQSKLFIGSFPKEFPVKKEQGGYFKVSSSRNFKDGETARITFSGEYVIHNGITADIGPIKNLLYNILCNSVANNGTYKGEPLWTAIINSFIDNNSGLSYLDEDYIRLNFAAPPEALLSIQLPNNKNYRTIRWTGRKK